MRSYLYSLASLSSCSKRTGSPLIPYYQAPSFPSELPLSSLLPLSKIILITIHNYMKRNYAPPPLLLSSFFVIIMKRRTDSTRLQNSQLNIPSFHFHLEKAWFLVPPFPCNSNKIDFSRIVPTVSTQTHPLKIRNNFHCMRCVAKFFLFMWTWRRWKYLFIFIP